MIYLIYYLAGAVLVWIADKRTTYETGWLPLSIRFGVSLLSWITILVFAFVSGFRHIGEMLEKKYDYKLPDWL